MKIHLIGIGGIGVSALAQYYLAKGHEVSGSDLVASEITNFVKQKGVKVFIGNFAKNIKKDLDLVVYSPAVKENNKELKQAKKYKIKTISYPEALGELTKEYYTIAVAGAHGKSTTTAMVALVLEKAGLDPTVIVGTKVKEFGDSNFRAGKSKLLVIEACEYDSSFLYYSPKIIVVTNVDKEHLDYFKTFEKVKKAFADFIVRLPADGFLISNLDDQNIPQIENPKIKTFGYSLGQDESKKLKKILKVPGIHNVSNALAVLQVARILEVPDEITFGTLSEFRGTWRRFEEINPKITKFKNLKIISDYAHHPNEISATLKAAREKYPKKNIVCVFQPHQHQRTHYLFGDFVKILQQAQDNHFVDKIIVTDIYDVAGRETKKINREVSSEKLVKKIGKKDVIYLPIKKIEKYIKENIKSGDVLIIMGAGDIYKLADKF
jgi:UDP-N-acetylmuramate--alanine ligase